MIDPLIVISEFLESRDIDFEAIDSNKFLITLPGDKKLENHISLVLGTELVITAFISKAPQLNSSKVSKWLEDQNVLIAPQHFYSNSAGDIFLVGKIAKGLISDLEIDRELAQILQICDFSFAPLLELGFENQEQYQEAFSGQRLELLSGANHLSI